MADFLAYLDASLEESRRNLARVEQIAAQAVRESDADAAERAGMIERLRSLETGFGRVRVSLEAAE